jgi:DNA excision repair protein ERCC-2
MCAMQMPTGTGKTITLLSLISSYQLAHAEVGKLIYCTRTVPEMEKVLAELQELVEYRSKYFQDGLAPKMLALGLSSRKNLCIHPAVGEEGSRESVDAKCMKLTAPWVRERASSDMEDIALCNFYEGLDAAGPDGRLDAGVYTLHDLRGVGRKKGWCPYFLARHMIAFANVVVFSYQYLIDPKVSAMISREMERECIVVFDEAHNIDNVCIEALSVNLRQHTLDAAGRNLTALRREVDRVKTTDAERLKAEYQRLVSGLQQQGALPAVANNGNEAGPSGASNTETSQWLATPTLPEDVLREAVPGNIRRAEHFLAFLQRFLGFLRRRLEVRVVMSEDPTAFLEAVQQEVAIDAKTLKFCYDRLISLLKTLEVTASDDYAPVHLVADFATLVATYSKGFSVITEPYDDRLPSVPDPIIQLSCLDASLAMRPIFQKFQSVIITSGTLSPLDLYPKILNFHPVTLTSLNMTLTRDCLCPVVLTRGADQLPVSTKFDMRSDPGVIRNYGRCMIS